MPILGLDSIFVKFILYSENLLIILNNVPGSCFIEKMIDVLSLSVGSVFSFDNIKNPNL